MIRTRDLKDIPQPGKKIEIEINGKKFWYYEQDVAKMKAFEKELSQCYEKEILRTNS